MIELLNSLFSGNPKVLILGYGKEGRSTYSFIKKHFPDLILGIADSNTEIASVTELLNDDKLKIITGSDYLDSLKHFDIIIKSPGVNIGNDKSDLSGKITSQTDLFLQCYANQVIGVTGTKGKSTTASLIKHFLEADNKKVLLLGNIGIPAFNMIDDIEKDCFIVFELSAHQLEYLHRSPHIAVLLNVFPEHLDYFNNIRDYQNAKFNICKFQNEDDCLIIHESLVGNNNNPDPLKSSSDELVRVYHGFENQKPEISNQDKKTKIIQIDDKNSKFKIKNSPLAGNHNNVNIEAALIAVGEIGGDIDVAINSLKNFKSLPHRLEYVGEFGGIRFVNDSISTVPESTIAAVKALKNVDTLILGGYDRGLDYTKMVEFLETSEINNFIFLGKAGDRMFEIFAKDNKQLFKVSSIESAFDIIVGKTTKGRICLLSPAAASYDQFHNFEHRGETFSSLAVKLQMRLSDRQY
ncbi:MAG: UDP-N-acetylmuramoyl-L-alanine--D-glutamate ligase [Bacteroidetes bacterium]|nr:UDP-N-acetylmuramoyl-L-alanine--D-glutamate ligase [Bacteroidota bacterium]MBL6943090.1 UDP-N-acetylmuramoyl-L-alanine--D-glutamate ligase [Bacteroidales bacterium]